MAKNVFGLDIGTSLIKAVTLDTKKGEKVLVQASIRPAPPKGIKSESQLDHDTLASSIKDLVTNAKIATKYVNVALSEDEVFTRVIDVPNLSDKELSSAIQWEAEQYVPSPLSEVILDYQVIQRPSGSDGPMQVLLVASPTTLINKYKKVVEGAGLIPYVFETAILSMTRALIRGKEQATILLVDIGGESTTLAIIKRGSLLFTYSIPTGGNTVTRAIANDFGFEAAQAEEYKKTYGLIEKNLEGKVAATVVPIINTIIMEVEKGVAFHREKYPSEQIDFVILSGGLAKLPGLVAFFAKRMGIEVEIATPWNGIIVDQTIFKETLQDGPLFVTAVGLALRDYD